MTWTGSDSRNNVSVNSGRGVFSSGN